MKFNATKMILIGCIAALVGGCGGGSSDDAPKDISRAPDGLTEASSRQFGVGAQQVEPQHVLQIATAQPCQVAVIEPVVAKYGADAGKSTTLASATPGSPEQQAAARLETVGGGFSAEQ